MPQWKDMTPEQQEAHRERSREQARRMHAEGRFAGRSKKEPGSAPKRSGGRKGDVTALGTLAWGALSLPVGIASPSAGFVMRLQMPQAGRDIDTLLKGTAFYDALTSGARAEKAVAAYHLGAPVALGMVGDAVDRMHRRAPDDPRIAQMMAWVEMMLRQVLADQGLSLPERPEPRPTEREVIPGPPEPNPDVVYPDSETKTETFEGNGEAPVEVAQAAAEASRFDHVE